MVADNAKTGERFELAYTAAKMVGNGSFGVVFQAKIVSTGEVVAIKKVLQDKRFKVPQSRHRLVVVTDAPRVRRTASWTLCGLSLIRTLSSSSASSTTRATRCAGRCR